MRSPRSSGPAHDRGVNRSADTASSADRSTAALAGHAQLVARLRDPAAFPHPAATVDVIETHISTVLLAGDFAYKLKKPVDLGFANFSTLARRRDACEAEVRLNRRSAPMLYLDVVPVTSEGGVVRFGGSGAVIDFAVRMRRFPQDARLDAMARAGRLTPELVDRLAHSLAAFHAACARAPEGALGTPGLIHRWADDNCATLRELAANRSAACAGPLAELEAWTHAEFVRREAAFDARYRDGYVRECHGDLHLGNLVVVDGDPVAFDCIEFNDELRFIDVASDIAFTWMDLLQHGLPALAARLLDGWLAATGDYAAVVPLRFYAVYRALVRAKVALIGGAQHHAADAAADETCAHYVGVAQRIARTRRPLVVAMAGVSGSGKTTVAQHLLERLGAVRVRSDVERKRLAGVSASERRSGPVGEGLYGAATTRATYDALAAAARSIVDGRFVAIVDASFIRRADRDRFAALARDVGAEFAVVVCDAPPDVLRARVATRLARGADASDATLEVLAHQLQAFERPSADEPAFTIATDRAPEALRAACDALADTLAARVSAT